jgi:hypothetical protein
MNNYGRSTIREKHPTCPATPTSAKKEKEALGNIGQGLRSNLCPARLQVFSGDESSRPEGA